MGNSRSVNKINFEDVQICINDDSFIIINTLPINNQKCLIKGTLLPEKESEIINKNLNSPSNIKIIIYGENNIDETIYQKYTQLLNMGFLNIYVYVGGLFEWLCLQDIYGQENFPTTQNIIDILQFKGKKKLNIKLLTNDID